MQPKPRRSALFMPASKTRALDKARALPADVLIFDLEDSVAPNLKDEARANAMSAVRGGAYGRQEIVVRINALTSPWYGADIEAVSAAAPEAVLVPKVETVAELQEVGAHLSRHGAPAHLRTWAMIETPRAVLNVAALADASRTRPETRLSCLVIGPNDIRKDIRALEHVDRLPLLYALQLSVLAARAAGLAILDGVYNNFRDDVGFRRECEQGRLFGMDGKTLIHPAQVDIANQVFAPSPASIAWAQQVIATFQRPENRDAGAVAIEGQMVERLHLEIARQTVAMAEAIAQRGQTDTDQPA